MADTALSKTTGLHTLDFKPLLAHMVTTNLVSRDEGKRVFKATRLSDKSDQHPMEVVARLRPLSASAPHNPLSLEQLMQWLANETELGYERIDPLKTNVTQVTALVSYAYASRLNILPLRVSRNAIDIATANPFDTHWLSELEQLLRKPIKLVLCRPDDIDRYLSEFYNLSNSIKQASNRSGDHSDSLITNLDQLVELGRSGKLDAEDHHVVNIVDWLLQYAFEQRASDIHLEPRRDYGEIRLRIDGVLHPVYQVPNNVMNAIIGRIKTLGRMDIAEKRRPLDGRLKTRTPDDVEIELRLSTIPTAAGEKMVMRIFDPEVLKRSFEQLGLSTRELETWQGFVNQPHGIILVTGPTGSGKTTTLYSTLRQLATQEVNVCTIEDPIEMVEPSFNQMQVQTGLDLSFAAGVRSLLRQDPDIIMIGEIRDLDTAEMAIQASLTGHLVLSTLHTNDAASAITRLLEIGVPAYLINATVLGIVAQRLVRTLCPHCKQQAELSSQDWESITLPWKIKKPNTVFDAKGCIECRNTGYQGRIGLYEILTMSPALRKVVTPGADLDQIHKQAYKEGTQALRVSGARHIGAGRTSLSEVLRVAPRA